MISFQNSLITVFVLNCICSVSYCVYGVVPRQIPPEGSENTQLDTGVKVGPIESPLSKDGGQKQHEILKNNSSTTNMLNNNTDSKIMCNTGICVCPSYQSHNPMKCKPCCPDENKDSISQLPEIKKEINEPPDKVPYKDDEREFIDQGNDDQFNKLASISIMKESDNVSPVKKETGDVNHQKKDESIAKEPSKLEKLSDHKQTLSPNQDQFLNENHSDNSNPNFFRNNSKLDSDLSKDATADFKCRTKFNCEICTCHSLKDECIKCCPRKPNCDDGVSQPKETVPTVEINHKTAVILADEEKKNNNNDDQWRSNESSSQKSTKEMQVLGAVQEDSQISKILDDEKPVILLRSDKNGDVLRDAIIVCFVPVFILLSFVIFRKGKHLFERRHYMRSNYLVDGMYSENNPLCLSEVINMRDR